MFLDSIECFQLLCKSTHKWGLYLSHNIDVFELAKKAAPYMTPDMFIWNKNIGLFDTRDAVMSYFHKTICDEIDPGIYAMVCDPDGYVVTENT